MVQWSDRMTRPSAQAWTQPASGGAPAAPPVPPTPPAPPPPLPPPPSGLPALDDPEQATSASKASPVARRTIALTFSSPGPVSGHTDPARPPFLLKMAARPHPPAKKIVVEANFLVDKTASSVVQA